MRKVSYSISGGLLRNGDPEYALKQICRSCEFEESKRTGRWKSDMTIHDVQQWLVQVGYTILKKLNGPKGEMIARVPPEITDKTVIEVHHYLSTVQAKQAMKTCGACGEFCREALEGELKEPIIIV